MNIFRIPALWLLSMSWHLWCIATLRPDFRRLGDTVVTFISFFALFCLASWLRWGVLGDVGAIGVLGTITFWTITLLLVSERTQRASTLFFSLLGCSAVVDFLASAVQMLGYGDFVSRSFWFLVEVALMLGAYAHFRAMPREVQASGYRRKTVAEPVETSA